MQPGRAVIVGLGSTGLSVARHLVARGWQVCGTDTRSAPPALAALQALAPAARWSTGGLDAALLQDADCVVVSPGLGHSDDFFSAARRIGLPLWGDIELFARSAPAARVVAITGTNGKSTVTTLVAHMAQQAGLAVRAGGNLAPPALDLLEGTAVDLFVLELSSYQLETTASLRPVCGTVLNITPDHLDRYADTAAYAAAKARLLPWCGTAVVNADDPCVAGMATGAARRVPFTLAGPAMEPQGYGLVHRDGQPWLARGTEALLPVAAMRITGLHNAANALAALALGEAAGLPLPAMLEALRSYRGLPHRVECVAERNGVRYIDDSKGTNVGATLAAVAGLEAPLRLILGGDGKGQDFSPLRAACAGKVRQALLIGRDAAAIGAALHGSCETLHCGSLEEAVRQAAAVAEPGEVVLLSPACASLDMFRDYKHRGEVFAAAARALAP
ncbi:MAG: UDP-N-acetylmuramoyl-L-alanyl-D-glutamate synthetase [Pseudomonadota bacterium]|jgi:UDP-N-acetylmuramoylalanine--D-glutamate ligase